MSQSQYIKINTQNTEQLATDDDLQCAVKPLGAFHVSHFLLDLESSKIGSLQEVLSVQIPIEV